MPKVKIALMNEKKLSIIIPVYNSENIVDKTVARLIEFLSIKKYNSEILLINDGSSDKSWEIIKNLANKFPEVHSINLLKNYGQHTAVFCGIQKSTGDFLITMDDDLQNPPEEIEHLVRKISSEDLDLVFGKFKQKKHSTFRKFGTKVIGYLNKKIFDKPDDIVLTNFRIFTKEVAQRVSQHKTMSPYIPGLLLMYSNKIANVEVEHKARLQGKSNYTLFKIISLVGRLLFNYSTYPLRLLVTIGGAVSISSFLIGLFYLFTGLVHGRQVKGWTTLVVLLSFLNGLILAGLGIIGEYLKRILNQISFLKSYEIKEEIN